MGVYIEGIEMPKGTNAMYLITPEGDVWELGDLFGDDKLIEGAKAVAVPPHGRLIDADVFESIKYELPDGQKAFNRGFHSGVQYVQRLIMDAPTIIEAEEG